MSRRPWLCALHLPMLAAVSWHVSVTRRPGTLQLAAFSFGQLTVTSMAIAIVLACAATIEVCRRCTHDSNVALAASALGVVAALGATRRPTLSPTVIMAVDAAWLSVPALGLTLVAFTALRPPPLRVTLVRGTYLAAVGAACALSDRGRGFASLLGAVPTRPPLPAARVLLVVGAIAIVIAGRGLPGLRWRSLRPTSWRRPEAVAVITAVWMATTVAERVIFSLPPDQLRWSTPPALSQWVMVWGVLVPMTATFGLVSSVAYALQLRAAGPTGSNDTVVLPASDPIGRLQSDMVAWLGDPTLTLTFANDEGGWISHTTSGTPPSGRYDRASTTVERGGTPICLIEHDVSLSAAPIAIETAALLAGMAFDANQAMLAGEHRLRESQHLSDRLLDADQETRTAVMTELEDGPVAELQSIVDAIDAGGSLQPLVQTLRQVTSKTRELSHGLYPPELIDSGLSTVIAHLGAPSRRLPPAIEITLFLAVADDPRAVFHDCDTMIQVIRALPLTNRTTLDRIAVLGGTVTSWSTRTSSQTIELPLATAGLGSH